MKPTHVVIGKFKDAYSTTMVLVILAVSHLFDIESWTLSHVVTVSLVGALFTWVSLCLIDYLVEIVQRRIREGKRV